VTTWRPDEPEKPRQSAHRDELWTFLGLMALLGACALVLAFG
jgi:hypothetical protein